MSLTREKLHRQLVQIVAMATFAVQERRIRIPPFDGVMPPLDVLNDEEIAAVVHYVRGAWGNGKLAPKSVAPVDAATVARLRAKKLTAEQVYAERDRLKNGAAKK